MSLRRAIPRFGSHLIRSLTVSEAAACAPNALQTLQSLSPLGSISAATLHLSRAFHVTSFASQETPLPDLIRNEIEYEKKNYTQPEELAAGPPSQFTLTETRGDTLLSLSRPEQNGEKITIDVMVNDQPEDESFESEEGVLDVDVGVVFTVQVAKGDQSLVFECKSDGNYLNIQHVSVEHTDEGEADDTIYTGPVFEELDDEVQQQFVNYLEERGINAELGGYLLRLVHDKEEREYQYWLEKVHLFLSK